MERHRPADEDINLSRIPVFVFPSTVYFNAHERDHLKQILTIYNPYEFPIRFKVLCNAPDLYTVIDSEGSIKSKNCVDLILRVSSDIHFDNNSPMEHKFRVQIYHYNDRKLLGRRDVPSIIHMGNLPPHLAHGGESSNLSSSDFQQFPGASGGSGAGGASSSTSKEHPISLSSSAGGNSNMGAFLPPGHQPNYVIIFTALICIIGLMLPISSESCSKDSSSSSAQSLSSMIPNYLHLTVNQKLLAAYALGLVTMVIFRP